MPSLYSCQSSYTTPLPRHPGIRSAMPRLSHHSLRRQIEERQGNRERGTTRVRVLSCDAAVSKQTEGPRALGPRLKMRLVCSKWPSGSLGKVWKRCRLRPQSELRAILHHTADCDKTSAVVDLRRYISYPTDEGCGTTTPSPGETEARGSLRALSSALSMECVCQHSHCQYDCWFMKPSSSVRSSSVRIKSLLLLPPPVRLPRRLELLLSGAPSGGGG